MANTKDLNDLLKGEPPQEAPKNDAARELARKAAALNPNLKAGESTAEFIENAQGVLAGKPAKGPPPTAAGALQKAQNADHLLELAQSAFAQEKREVEAEIAVLQARLSGLKGKYMNEVIDQLIRLDPGLGSPVTQEALKQKRTFLDAVGFTTAKFLERQRLARK
jgi:hypothetical protein